MKKSFYVIAIATAILTACSPKESGLPETINIDLDNITEIPIEKATLIPLETTDSSLIYSVENMLIANNRFFIQSRDLLKMFDATTGKYITDLARKGEGPGEFQFIGNLWVSGDTINVFDLNQEKIMYYSTGGEFLSEKKLFENAPKVSPEHPGVSFLIKAPDGNGYYSINTWMGGTGAPVPTYSKYSPECIMETTVKGRFLNTGGFGYSRAAIDRRNDRILTWETAIDTLFAITDTTVNPVMVLDYGQYSIPHEIQAMPERWQRLMALKDRIENEKIQTILDGQYFTPVKNNIFYNISYFKGDGVKTSIVALYPDKASSETFNLVDPDGRFSTQQFLGFDGENILIDLRDNENEEANPTIARIPLSAFE